MSETENTTAALPKPIWWLVIVATLVATGLACAVGVLTGDEITSAEDFNKHGGEWVSLAELYYILTVCAAAWLLTWLAFYLMSFRKRAKLWKSIVALVTMLPFVFIIGILTRVFTFEYYFSLDRAQIAEIRHQSALKIAVMRNRVADETGQLRVNGNFPELHKESDVPAALTFVRQERDTLRTYQQQALAQLRQTKAEIGRLDIYGEIKAEALEHYDAMLAPNSNMNRHFALNIQLMDMQEAAFVYLQQHRSGWMFVDGTLTFLDAATMTAFNAKLRNSSAITSQMDRLQGQGGPGFGGDPSAANNQ